MFSFRQAIKGGGGAEAASQEIAAVAPVHTQGTRCQDLETTPVKKIDDCKWPQML